MRYISTFRGEFLREDCNWIPIVLELYLIARGYITKNHEPSGFKHMHLFIVWQFWRLEAFSKYVWGPATAGVIINDVF